MAQCGMTAKGVREVMKAKEQKITNNRSNNDHEHTEHDKEMLAVSIVIAITAIVGGLILGLYYESFKIIGIGLLIGVSILFAAGTDQDEW